MERRIDRSRRKSSRFCSIRCRQNASVKKSAGCGGSQRARWASFSIANASSRGAHSTVGMVSKRRGVSMTGNITEPVTAGLAPSLGLNRGFVEAAHTLEEQRFGGGGDGASASVGVGRIEAEVALAQGEHL